MEFRVPVGLPAAGVRPRLRFVIGNTIFPNANRIAVDELVVQVRVPSEQASYSAWQLNNLRQFHVALELPEGLLSPGTHRLEISPEALPGLPQVWPTSIDAIELELEPGHRE